MDVNAVSQWRATVRHSYAFRDAALYALAIGAVRDPLDRRQLRTVYEADPVIVPTIIAILASPGFWAKDRPELGIDYQRLVHGEQRLQLMRPLSPQATVVGHSTVVSIDDKGAGKGAVVTVEKLIEDETGAPIGTARQILFCRGDGGSGQWKAAAGATLPALEPAPSRAPDHLIAKHVPADAALLYRLCGDLNPLHIDPEVAARAGFERPILHGLATYGMAAVAVMQALGIDDPSRLRGFDARFSAPVLPGDTLEFKIWATPEGAQFECICPAREVRVLSHGMARLAKE